MKTKARKFAVALLALAAVGASLATAAQATNLTAASYPAIIEGEQVGSLVFAASGRSATCEVVAGSGSITGPTEEGVLESPQIEDCHANILGSQLGVTFVYGPSCVLNLHTNGTVVATCSGSEDLTVTVYDNDNGEHLESDEICRYTAKPQTAENAVALENKAGGTVLANVNASVKFERTKGTALLCGSASQTGTLQGTITLSGETGEGSPNAIDVN